MRRSQNMLDWLKDAHAMEVQAVEILEKQRDRLENYPELKLRIAGHVEETRRQGGRLAECIRRLEGDVSTIKDTAGKLMGNLNAMFNSLAGDEVVKNTIVDYAFEHFEIACYKSLIAAAVAVGDEHVEQVCRLNLQEEEDMAVWLDQHIESVTRKFLDRDESETEAKR